MRFLIPVLSRLYRGLIRLYPRVYQAEFGDELVEVFDQVVQDASELGGARATWRLLRELFDLPGVLVRTHLNWGKNTMAIQLFPHTSDQTPWPTALLSMVPYVILGPLAVVISYHPGWDPQLLPWLQKLFIALASLAIGVSFIIGAIRKFPRWSYPCTIYIVIMLTFLVTYLVNGTPWDINHESSILMWVVGVAFLVSLALPPLRPFLTNLRQDWTLLSYGLYAWTLLIASSQDHDEVPSLNLLVLLPSIIWILGALAHLRLTSARQRVLVLITSVVVGIAIWWSPVYSGVSGSLAGIMMVSSFMMVFWAILAGVVIAPILIGVIISNRQRKDTPA